MRQSCSLYCGPPDHPTYSSYVNSYMDIARALEQGKLMIADILKDEASLLCESSPIPSDVKRPTASRSRLTKMAKMGKGSAHCILQKWPVENTPSKWGRQNEVLLLNQPINPDIWERLGSDYNSIKLLDICVTLTVTVFITQVSHLKSLASNFGL